jgi:hypothetical protein
VTPQLKFRLPEEQAEIERVAAEVGCNYARAIEIIEKRAAAKKSTPVQAPAHWRDWEDDREE